MPRSKLGDLYSPKPTPAPAKPEAEPKVVNSGEVEAEKELRKIPSTPYWVDLNTGLIYLDKAVMAMFK